MTDTALIAFAVSGWVFFTVALWFAIQKHFPAPKIPWVEGGTPKESGEYLCEWTVEDAPHDLRAHGVYTYFDRPTVGHKSLGVMDGWQLVASTTLILRHAKINEVSND